MVKDANDPFFTFRAIWGCEPYSIFAAGYPGEFRYFNGERWYRIGNTENDIRDIWGTSASDVYFVGTEGMFIGTTGIILHYDGHDWNYLKSGIIGNLNGVWGSSPDDVFIVGEDGIILHYKGEKRK